MSQIPPVSTVIVNQPSPKVIMSNLIPRSAATYEKLSHLYKVQAKDYAQMGNDVSDLLIDLNQKVRETTSNINQLMKKATKEEDVKQKAGKFLDGKHEELKNKNKNIESIISGMKETVSKMSPDALADLPVEKERILTRTFEMLYKVLYHKDVSQHNEFKWSVFKKKALKTQNGEDFQSRMANINIRSLSEETYSQILAIKEDPQFYKLSENPKYSSRLFDLGDWMEYVCKGYEFTNDWRGTQSHYEMIQKNVMRRGLEGVNVKEALEFWKETHHNAQEFKDFFNDVASRLKSIQIHFDKNAPKLAEAARSRRSKIDQINLN